MVFFYGHFQTYGVNIQVACDHQCVFLFSSLAGPGIMGDRDAMNEVELYDLIERLPSQLRAIADCAYTPTENVTKKKGDFNYYASQHCIYGLK